MTRLLADLWLHMCILVLTMGLFLTGVAPHSNAATPITLDKPIHFLASDGKDVLVEAGTYAVDMPPETRVRLTAEGKPDLVLEARTLNHMEKIDAPLAMTAPGEDNDVQHLVLLLPNGQALDAAGSLSGTRSRGVNSSLLSASQLKIFVAQAVPVDNSPVVLGTSTQPVKIPGLLSVYAGQTSGPNMQVVNSPIGGGVWAKNFYIHQMNQPGSPAHLCWRVAGDGVPGNLLTTCTTSQSSLRYKTDVRPFTRGLDLVNRLNPVHFAWKDSGIPDIGLVAEEVANIEPLLTFKNHRNEIEGIKYETLSVALINAIKEQQAQINELRQLLQAQQEQLQRYTR